MEVNKERRGFVLTVNTKIKLLKIAEYFFAVWVWYLVLFKLFNWGLFVGWLIVFVFMSLKKFVNSYEPKREYSKRNSTILSIVLYGALIIIYYDFLE